MKCCPSQLRLDRLAALLELAAHSPILIGLIASLLQLPAKEQSPQMLPQRRQLLSPLLLRLPKPHLSLNHLRLLSQ